MIKHILWVMVIMAKMVKYTMLIIMNTLQIMVTIKLEIFTDVK